MTYTVLLLGWNVGPWKCSGLSKDGLVLLGWDGQRLEVIGNGFHDNLFTRLSGGITLASLLTIAGGWTASVSGLKVVVAIDAVFGWPRRFKELVTGKSDCLPRTGKKDRDAENTNTENRITENRFLYRETERFLDHVLRMKSSFPKTAVGDAIGSAATKAQYVLSCLRKQGDTYVPPFDPWDEGRAKDAQVTLIEVYPGVTKFSPTFENMDLPQGTKMRLLGKSDPEDALRCAMVAACYARMTGAILSSLPTLYVPTDATAKEGYDAAAIPTEGWIFSPKKV